MYAWTHAILLVCLLYLLFWKQYLKDPLDHVEMVLSVAEVFVTHGM